MGFLASRQDPGAPITQSAPTSSSDTPHPALSAAQRSGLAAGGALQRPPSLAAPCRLRAPEPVEDAPVPSQPCDWTPSGGPGHKRASPRRRRPQRSSRQLRGSHSGAWEAAAASSRRASGAAPGRRLWSPLPCPGPIDCIWGGVFSHRKPDKSTLYARTHLPRLGACSILPILAAASESRSPRARLRGSGGREGARGGGVARRESSGSVQSQPAPKSPPQQPDFLGESSPALGS